MDSPLFIINQPSFLLSCTGTTFSWSSSIPTETIAEILFQIHWIPSLQPPPSPSAPIPSPTYSNEPPPLGPDARRSLARRAPPNSQDSIVVRTFTALTTARSFDWAAVDIPEGVYFLSATIDQDSLHLVEASDTFPVYNGPDLTCLQPLPSVPSGSSGPSQTAPPPSISPSTTDSNVSGPTSTGTNQLPVGASGKNTNVGAIAGGVVGGVAAVIILIILAFFLCRRRRHSNNSRPAPSIISSKSGKRGLGKSGEQIGNWKGLGSVDLQDPETGGTLVDSMMSSRKESANSSEENASSVAVSIPPMRIYTSSDEKRTSITMSPRKPARKPVPSYLDIIPPTTPFTESTTNLESSRHNTYPNSVPSSPTPDYSSYDSRRSSSRPLKNTYADYPKDEEEIQAEMMVANLQRSANHGDMLQMKPVHYLMPDLPLEQQYRAGEGSR